MNNIMLILCAQSNKGIEEGVKNKIIGMMNEEEFKIMQQNINKFVDKQIQENQNETQ